MKRNLTRLLPLLLMAVVTAFSVSGQKIYLSHGGGLTAFATSEIDKALNASVKNDTIFLPEGAIPGFTVTKDITICGAGQNTIVSGNILIHPADTTAHWENTLLDGMYVKGMVNQVGPVKGLTLRNISMEKYSNCSDEYVTSANDNTDATYISCCFRNGAENLIGANQSTPRKISNIKFVNCMIQNDDRYNVLGPDVYQPPVGALNFYNCYFLGFSNYNSANCYYDINATNCIFSADRSTYEYGLAYYEYAISSNSVLTNCLLQSSGNLTTSPKMINCWINNTNSQDPSFNPDDIISKGYIGTDGTCVGHLGGGIPYSLDSSLPSVKERKMEVDYENNVINVTLKFSGTEEE